MSSALTASYINTEFTLKWFTLFVIFSIVESSVFTVPELEIELLQPKGIHVSISDSPGIQVFAFHANINKEINKTELGDISKQVSHPTNGSWMFIDKYTELKSGDVLHYWYFIQYKRIGITEYDLSFQVE